MTVTAQLIVIVPTRSRPHNVMPLVDAFRDTRAFDDGAELVFVYDKDDPALDDYMLAVADVATRHGHRAPVMWLDASRHEQLVPKLNKAAFYLQITRQPFALGFMGDDHRPQTVGWVKAYLDELRRLGTGVVSCPDGYRTDDLPTQWAMTADIVEHLQCMVPAPVEHLYCDDAIRAVATQAGCYSYLPDLLIEHLHPVAEKAPADEQYDRVNGRDQYRKDRPIYRAWKRDGGLAFAVSVVRMLREES